MRIRTLVFPLKSEEVLLGWMKRNFTGREVVNAYGGKLEEGETIEECAKRELHQECGLDAAVADLRPMGHMDFSFPHRPEWDQRVHLFTVHRWTGEPGETDEMRPEWFRIDSLPYDTDMWPADKHWWPSVLRGERTVGEVVFNGEGDSVRQVAMLEPHEHTIRP